MNAIQIINHAISRVIGTGPFDHNRYTQAEIEAVHTLQRVRHYLLIRMIEEV